MMSNKGRYGSYRRRKGRARRRLAFVALLALVGVGAWWTWFRDGSAAAPSVAGAQDDSAASLSTDLPDQYPGRTEPVREPRRDPAADRAALGASSSSAPSGTGEQPLSVLQMGRPVDGAGANRGANPTTTPSASDSLSSAIRDSSREPAPPAGGQGQVAPGAAPATNPAPTAPATAPGAETVDAAVGALVSRADAAVKQNRLVEARTLLNRALHEPGATPGARQAIRERMTAINDTLMFSPTVAPGDTLVEKYTIQSGDVLSLLPRKHGLEIDWRLLKRVNGIRDENRIIPGQTIKLVKGPFHAVVDKSDFRMDLYSGDSADRVYIRSCRVGLGEQGSTPLGEWVVKPGSKLVNPRWVNPRTGEAFAAEDPKNPIGERWIGLDGADPQTRALLGYGIHGTIDPDSLGREMSMGCIRLGDEDVELVYELLVEQSSTVRIVP